MPVPKHSQKDGAVAGISGSGVAPVAAAAAAAQPVDAELQPYGRAYWQALCPGLAVALDGRGGSGPARAQPPEPIALPEQVRRCRPRDLFFINIYTVRTRAMI